MSFLTYTGRKLAYFVCQFCGMKFSRQEPRDKHERICPHRKSETYGNSSR